MPTASASGTRRRRTRAGSGDDDAASGREIRIRDRRLDLGAPSAGSGPLASILPPRAARCRRCGALAPCTVVMRLASCARLGRGRPLTVCFPQPYPTKRLLVSNMDEASLFAKKMFWTNGCIPWNIEIKSKFVLRVPLITCPIFRQSTWPYIRTGECGAKLGVAKLWGA